MDTNLSNTTRTDFENLSNLNYSVDTKSIDQAGHQEETYWNNPNWNKYLGYFKQIPEFKEPIRALARWTVGKGFTTDARTKGILDNITGWGEDSLQSILTNLIIIKKVNGDAYAEIIRNDKGTLINLKVLNPQFIQTVVNKKGMIIRYEEIDPLNKNMRKEYKPYEILHLCNDRIANEIHGTSALEACQWELDAKREAMADWRRISHRSTIRVMYIDAEDKTKLALIKTQYEQAIKYGEVMILPAKRGEAEFVEYNLPPIDAFIRWIEYLDRRIYQSLGVPKAIADTADFTEAASKVGYLTFEPVYTEEQTLLEQDLWNQLAIKVKFNRPPSLSGVVQEDEAKNTGQMGFQPTETQATIGRVE